MEDRQIEIMQVAMRFFSKKGFHATSMQEIAADSGISKGSLYKCFESKEELLIQVFKFNHDNMVEKAKRINADSSLAPKEKLNKMLIVEFEGILENKEYFNLLTKSLLFEKNQKIRPLMQQVRAEMMDWHKEILLQIYGEDVAPFIWDAVLSLQGILKEYVSIVIQDQQKLDATKIAEYVVSCVDAIVKQHKNKAPVLKDDMMKNYLILKENKKWIPIEDQIIQVLSHIKFRLKSELLPLDKNKEIEKTILLFNEELKEKKPRIFLLNSLLANLEKNLKEKEELNTIENLIKLLD
ncbi:putative HTH-type transcriptional regulator YcnC [Paraliobacillus quinghaiensis]|uniref:HTH-type transcriptional regulator YcnC n=1 Tax=Paraliobacillus quinghaiensis TaxID=470815 RepID=A0A917WVZ8_9BACI|nr:TetR/AcrR family transcriptional regulator [Paraliobacillus quinghaiensis]GGM33628.1 putative HTH-type transcriptional regulator YcnC [Paraliobacillus quinghaiensis]